MIKKILIFILICSAVLWPIQGFAIPDGTGNEILIGNVGINSMAPGKQLDVQGTVRAVAYLGDGSALTNLPVAESGGGFTDDGTTVHLTTSTDNLGIGTVDASNGKLIVTGGNVGIGSTVPNHALLELTGDGAKEILRINDVGPNDTTPFVVSSSGNVGIGTTSPTQMLQIGAESSGSSAKKTLKFGSGGYGEPAAYQTDSNGDKITFYNADNYDGRIGVGNAGDMWFKSSGLSANTGEFRFFNGSTPTERMRIDANGNVGIGTTLPTHLLNLSSSTTSGTALGLYNSTNAAGNRNWAIAQNQYVYADLHFKQSNAKDGNPVSAGTSRLVIDASGNVGIGTWLLSSKFAVNGGAAIGSSYLNIAAPTDGLIVQGNVGIGTTVPSGLLEVGAQKFNVLTGGNVGVGSITPGQKLDVQGTVRATAFVGDGSGLTNVTAASGGGFTDDGTVVHLTTSTDNVGIGTTAPGNTLHIKGTEKIEGGGVDGTLGDDLFFAATGYPTTNTHKIQTSHSNTVSLNKMIFGLADGSSGFNSIMTLLGNGNVGIGTTLPLTKLDVTSGTANIDGNTSNVLNLTGANVALTTSNTNLFVSTNNAQAADIGGSIALGGLYRAADRGQITFATIKSGKTNSTDSNYSGYLVFGTRTNGSSVAEAMRIDNAGNVGIGTTLPTSKLHIKAWSTTYGTGGVRYEQSSSGTYWDLMPSADSLYFGGNALTYLWLTTASLNFGDGGTIYNKISTRTGTNYFNSGNVGIGTTLPSGLLEVGAQKFNVLTGGNVGVGSITPGQKLDVQGTVRASYFSGDGSGLTNVTAASGGGFTDDGTVVHLTTSTDNVGIGTVAPVSKFQIISAYEDTLGNENADIGFGSDGANPLWGFQVGAAANYPLMLNREYSSVAYNVMTWDRTNGNVGIGTTLPESALHVGVAGSAVLTLQRIDTSLSANDPIGKIQFYAKDTSTTTNMIVADIEAQATNTVGSDINPGRLIFRTTPTTVAATPLDRMTIDENGNVGIGSTSGSSKLTINDIATNSVITNTATLYQSGSGNGTGTGIRLGYSTTANTTARLSGFYDGAGVAMSFETNGAASNTERMRIASGGNVGIGSITPGQNLDVQGTVRASYFSGDGSGLTNVTAASGGGFTDDGTVVHLTTSTDNVGIGTVDVSNAKLIVTGGNVGIGTTTPVGGLVVMNGNMGIGTWVPTQKLAIGGGYALFDNTYGIRMKNAAGTEVNILTVSSSDNVTLATPTGGDMYLNGSGTFILKSTGVVGLGHVTPANKLAVNGSTSIGANFNTAAPTNGLIVEGSVGIGTFNVSGGSLIVNTGNVGIGTTLPSGLLEVGAQKFNVLTGGNVGIGSITPGQKLDVQGTVRATYFSGDGSALTNLPSSSSGWTLGASNVGISTTNNVGIGTNLTTTAALTVMSGNVGIGTWVPQGALQVVGGQVLIADGLVGTPSIGFSSDNDGTGTGFYRTTTNRLGVSINGVLLGQFLSTGFEMSSGYSFSWNNLGSISSSSDGIYRWSANGGANINRIILGQTDGTGPALGVSGTTIGIINGDGSVNANLGIGTVYADGRLIVSGGNVGIGSIRPGQVLDVQGTVRASYFSGDGSALTNLPGGSSGWTLGASNVGISTTNNVGIGTNLTTTAALTVMSGNVGIGTWKPAYSLDITSSEMRLNNPNGATALNIRSQSGSTSYINFTNTSSNLWRIYSSQVTGATTTGDMVFYSYSTGGNVLSLGYTTASVGIGTIKASSGLAVMSGNVGIGTWKPIGALEVKTSNANSFIVDSVGNVGIGTITPVGGLTVMNGNVGIGTWMPRGALEVKNSIVFSTEVANSTATTATITWADGNKQNLTLTGSTDHTITFANPQGVGNYMLKVIQGDASNTITWATSPSGTFRWSGGAAPTLTTTINKADIISCYWDTVDYYCTASLNF